MCNSILAQKGLYRNLPVSSRRTSMHWSHWWEVKTNLIPKEIIKLCDKKKSTNEEGMPQLRQNLYVYLICREQKIITVTDQLDA